MTRAPALAAALLASVAWNARAAGSAEAHFLAPEAYRDIGDDLRQREDNLRTLDAIVRKLGAKRLADGQALRLDFVDIDLAGRPRLSHRTPGDYRIMTGQADWPHLRLHWTLRTPGAPDRSGDADLVDMDYLQRMPAWRSGEPLAYEQRMLDDWLRRTIPHSLP